MCPEFCQLVDKIDNENDCMEVYGLMHYANRKYIYIVIRVINYRSHCPASSRLAVSTELFRLLG